MHVSVRSTRIALVVIATLVTASLGMAALGMAARASADGLERSRTVGAVWAADVLPVDPSAPAAPAPQPSGEPTPTTPATPETCLSAEPASLTIYSEAKSLQQAKTEKSAPKTGVYDIDATSFPEGRNSMDSKVDKDKIKIACALPDTVDISVIMSTDPPALEILFNPKLKEGCTVKVLVVDEKGKVLSTSTSGPSDSKVKIKNGHVTLEGFGTGYYRLEITCPGE